MTATTIAPRIAVLIACHDRRETTQACLRSLAGQAHFDEANLYLVDDGSKDGTADMVRRLMPRATVLSGNGDLYWNGGMNLAWRATNAAGTEFTHVLWLNDDVVLHDRALDRMVKDSAASPDGAIIVGATHSHGDRDAITYGGHIAMRRDRPLRFSLARPSGTPQPVDTMSGNVVLVPILASRRIGHLDPAFRHIFGDLDYGLRARHAGIPVLLASQPAGTCEANPLSGSWDDDSASRLARIARRLKYEKSIHARDWRVLVRRWDNSLTARARHVIAPYARIMAGRPNRHASKVVSTEAAL